MTAHPSRPTPGAQPRSSIAESVFDGPAISQRNEEASRERHRRQLRLPVDGKRRDIQGLRMVAVVAVVVNHLTDHPQGGFVGVDVFFVISGFLITSHLVRDLGRGQGPITYIGDFYRRRIRRLFPAALLVIGLSLILAHGIFVTDRFHNTLVDGGWATIFWANWHFVDLGTNYFTAGLPDSPFQHYWSLSVEEQFYVVWPIALFALVLITAQRRSVNGRRLVAGIAATVLCIASLIIAFAQSTSDPTTAYFSTFTRGWELGLGALLACVVPYLRASRPVLTAMSWVGMAVIAVSLFTVHGGSGFPAPGALAPCLGAALVIAATSPGVEARNAILTNRASVFIGDISYSVYLVHFPVIILLAAWMGGTSTYYYVAAPALMLGLSIALYTLVEQPVLNSRFLLPRRDRGRPRNTSGPSAVSMSLAALTVAIIGLGAIAVWPGQDAENAAKLAQVQAAIDAGAPSGASSGGATSAIPAGPAQAALTNELKTALLTQTWPKLTPPLDQPVVGKVAAKGCAVQLRTPAQCTWGNKSADNKHTIYLAGDSTSTFYDDGFVKMMDSLPNWKLRPAGGSACAFAATTINKHLDVEKVKECPQRNVDLVAEIKAAKPGVLIVTTIKGDPPTNASVEAELDKVKSAVGKIVILPAPVPGDDPQDCYTKTSTPISCKSEIKGYYNSWISNEKAMAKRLGATFIDPTAWYCVAGECPIFAGGVPMKLDQAHITPQYGVHIEPVILEALRRAKVLPKA